MNQIEKSIFDYALKRGIAWAILLCVLAFLYFNFSSYLFYLSTVLWFLAGIFFLTILIFVLRGLSKSRKLQAQIHQQELKSSNLFVVEQLQSLKEDAHFSYDDNWLVYQEGWNYMVWPRNTIAGIRVIDQNKDSLQGILELLFYDGSPSKRLIYRKDQGNTTNTIQAWLTETEEELICPYCGGRNEISRMDCAWCGQLLIPTHIYEQFHRSSKKEELARK